jgi:hypothetical protein
MSTTLTSTVHIAATPAQVWAVLADLDRYPSWNPFIVAATGTVQPGERLVLRMQPVGGRATTVRPRLLEVVPGRRLRWLGRVGLPGLLDAEHDFVLEADEDGTLLVQREVFRGVLVPLVARMLWRTTLPAFRAMDEALRVQVEQQTADRA